MKLATAQDVLERGSISISGTGPTSTIASVLEAVTVIVENLLDTSLTDNTRLDVFDYQIPKYRSSFQPVRFYLSQAFHSDTQAMEARVIDSDGARLTTSGQGILLDPTSYFVDPVKGYVTLLEDVDVGYGVLSFYYSGGFASESGLIKNVPDWMKEAAISSTIRMYHAQSLTRTRKDAMVPTNELATHVSLALNSHYRRVSDVKYPVMTVVD